MPSLPGVKLDLSEDQEFFRDTTRRFLEAESPLTSVRELFDTAHGFDPDWWRRAAELGWTAMFATEAVGGGPLSGDPASDTAIVAEEIGRMVAPGPFLPVNVVVAGLTMAGGEHAELVRELVAGQAVATWALAEDGPRWDATGLSTRVETHGDEVVVSGVKHQVEALAAARYVLVTGRADEGLAQVLVPTDATGVSVRHARSLDFTRRFGILRLDEVRLPRSALVAGPGDATERVEQQLQIALVMQCAETVGALDRVFSTTLEYMGDRYAFGRPIASYQALKHRVADLLLQLETAKGCVDAAAAAIADQREDAAIEASVAKAYVGECSTRLIQECMQFLGGISVTWEHDIHLYLRRVTVNRAVLGTPAQHRERICSLMGL